jgi:hypothetical protein
MLVSAMPSGSSMRVVLLDYFLLLICDRLFTSPSAVHSGLLYVAGGRSQVNQVVATAEVGIQQTPAYFHPAYSRLAFCCSSNKFAFTVCSRYWLLIVPLSYSLRAATTVRNQLILDPNACTAACC